MVNKQTMYDSTAKQLKTCEACMDDVQENMSSPQHDFKYDLGMWALYQTTCTSRGCDDKQVADIQYHIHDKM